MSTERPDLNGMRLVEPGKSDVWLIFHGRRHRVPSAVQAMLFIDADFTVSTEVDAIARGPDLIDGSLLIRAEGAEEPVYLLTVAYEGGVRRHMIPNQASMRAFGFDTGKAAAFPAFVVGALPSGRDIWANGSG